MKTVSKQKRIRPQFIYKGKCGNTDIWMDDANVIFIDQETSELVYACKLKHKIPMDKFIH